MKITKELLVNATTRYLSTMFSGYFGQQSPKHNHWFDFGFPVDITFDQYYTMYKRNALARAGIVRPVSKTWRDYPRILENIEDTHDETKLEQAIRERFEDIMFWESLKEADEKSRVGGYAGIILRIADGKKFEEPAVPVSAGLNSLVELIPVYSKQLEALEFVTDERSPDYGKPKYFQFNESAIPGATSKRQSKIHPSRVFIWSKNSSLYAEPALEAGYNDLITIEKVIGAGGEGFWKEAKSSPIMSIDKDAKIEALATMLGVSVEQLPDKMDEIVTEWQKGFDQLLMVQGIDTKKLAVTLPQPKEFYEGAIMSFAASLPIPMKILLGSQTGERASTEDVKEWNDTIQARRTNYVVPNIRRLLGMLENLKIFPKPPWDIYWPDLTESTGPEKLEKAKGMATINKEMMGIDRVFLAKEIRAEMDFEEIDEADDLPDDLDDDLEDDLQDEDPDSDDKE